MHHMFHPGRRLPMDPFEFGLDAAIAHSHWRRSPAGRFWTRVDRSTGPEGCWPWLGARSAGGYGVWKDGRAKAVAAHRAAYEAVNGTVAGALFVCHRCDNPPCCNPAHLYAGTAKQNAADMVARGRGRHRRLLTDEQAAAAHLAWASGASKPDIARLLGVAYSVVTRALRVTGKGTMTKAKNGGVERTEPSSVATARYAARKGRGLVTVHSTLTADECLALDRVIASLGLPEHGGRHARGGRAEAIRRLILAHDPARTEEERKLALDPLTPLRTQLSSGL